MNVKQIAQNSTMQSFLNCFLRETQEYKHISKLSDSEMNKIKIPLQKEDKGYIHCELLNLGVHLYIPLRYWSVTGRHLFSFPLFYSYSENSVKLFELDYITLVSLVMKELSIKNEQGETSKEDELMMRVILSCQNIEKYIEERYSDIEYLYDMDLEFIDAEQSLLFGHLMHPTPKSRQGISDSDAHLYSPELKGKFSLYYFSIHPSIIYQGTSLEQSASEIIKNQVMKDPYISDEFKYMFVLTDYYVLLPVHPWQAEFLMKKPKVKELMQKGLIKSLGKHGRQYYPTSSLRTVYHPQEDFMMKFSLNVKITNSVRTNKNMELERGVEIKKLLKGEVGKQLQERYPKFNVITDPAFITVVIDDQEESGFEVILRENPFKQESSLNATPIAALCQDSIEGNTSRLAEIIRKIAMSERRTTEEVSVEWFKKYLDISLKPIMWLFHNYGIAVEAHQQNSVVQLKDGYPEKFYYRDNQGYYYCQSFHERLNDILPGISEKSNTICTDAIADERLRYYFFFNHLFGLINAFGTGGVIEEEKLLQEVRTVLKWITVPEHCSSQLIDSLLFEKKLPCKANLLTRFHDMDELTGTLEAQSVYVDIDNPLFYKELITNGTT